MRTYNNYQHAQLDYLRQHSELTNEQMAAFLNVSASKARNAADYYGIQWNKQYHKLSADDKEFIRRNFWKMRNPLIACLIGCSLRSVENYAKKQGFKKRILTLCKAA